jgi:hypothetical protein
MVMVRSRQRISPGDRLKENVRKCGEPAISIHSHHVSLVQLTTRLLPVTRDPGSNPLGGTYVHKTIYNFVRVRG